MLQEDFLGRNFISRREDRFSECVFFTLFISVKILAVEIVMVDLVEIVGDVKALIGLRRQRHGVRHQSVEIGNT